MSAPPSPTVRLDLRSEAALRDADGFFRALREHDPVFWSEATRAWILTGYDAVRDAFADARLSSDRLAPMWGRLDPEARAGLAETFDLLRGWMVFRDPPVHDALREPIGRAFTPRRVESLVPRIRAIVAEHLDRLADADAPELVRDFAFPLPAIVIAELLGIPAGERERFQLWSRQLAGIVFGAVDRGARDAAAAASAREFTRYFGELVRAREAAPGDDLVSALVAARDAGEGLDRDLLVGACTMLLFAGHETTTTLVANAVALLCEHPDQLERLRAEPALVETAVEEVLRYRGPARAMIRYVGEPHERGGHAFEPGQRVYLAIAGANHDPAVFPEPGRFDVGRAPNPHLGFGYGRHFCLGAHLARAEARIALGALIERFPRLRLAEERVAWGSGPIGVGIASLPLELA